LGIRKILFFGAQKHHQHSAAFLEEKNKSCFLGFGCPTSKNKGRVGNKKRKRVTTFFGGCGKFPRYFIAFPPKKTRKTQSKTEQGRRPSREKKTEETNTSSW
jgi:hypothetical protein